MSFQNDAELPSPSVIWPWNRHRKKPDPTLFRPLPFLKEANMRTDVSKITEAILGIERSINKRWINGDCNGFLETYGEDVGFIRILRAQPGDTSLSHHPTNSYLV